ncbi:MAG: hypothetical protein HC875_40850 [Anaerolineales bacterium]|nr:hypothetical protein [Anaerolineales bacterium]
MGLQTQNQTYEMILQRIEAISQELQTLRTMVKAAQTQPSSENLAQKLFGVLGQGTWTEYDLTLDWQRFEA